METRIADYLDFLGDLGAANAPYFLEGGQAVNLWAEYFRNKGTGEALERYNPICLPVSCRRIPSRSRRNCWLFHME